MSRMTCTQQLPDSSQSSDGGGGETPWLDDSLITCRGATFEECDGDSRATKSSMCNYMYVDHYD